MEWTRQIDRAAGRWTERSGRSGMGWSATTGTHWLRGDAAMRRDAWDAHFRPGAHQQSPGGRGGGGTLARMPGCQDPRFPLQQYPQALARSQC